MITTHSHKDRYRVQFSSGTHHAEADVLPHKGGQDAGFGPHELMEASLACCINMWIRMQADKLGIPVGPIAVTVSLKRDHPEEAVFEYTVEVKGDLDQKQRATLLQLADDCPVRRTLGKKLSFKRVDACGTISSR